VSEEKVKTYYSKGKIRLITEDETAPSSTLRRDFLVEDNVLTLC
jgi:uncharacterized protein YnzC (UPF0291/DUF896 family)